jgi:mannonate dehydratase
MPAMRTAVGQLQTVSRDDLVFAKQIGASGVTYNSVDLDIYQHRRALGLPDWGDFITEPTWTYDALSRLRELVESYGLALEAMENLPQRMQEAIRLGTSDRDRQIDDFCRTIENIGRVGIPILGYHFMLLQVNRTDLEAPGRGGALCTAFDRGKLTSEPLAYGRRIEADEMWERYTHFIKRVLPVAESANVKLALHPDDPPIPELYGVARIFGTLEGHKRALEEIAPSPYHGLDFCCGSWTEAGPQLMYQALDYFSSRKKVFYVHFRNVHGAVPNFQESFIDEGDFDEVEAIRIMKRNGFDGFLIDDHVPGMINDTAWGHRSRAYATGYIKALVKTVTA